MSMQISTIPTHPVPALTGAEELSWHYILNLIFSHAYHLGCESIHFMIPDSSPLRTMIELRQRAAGLMADRSGKTALAWCLPGQGVSQAQINKYQYVFSLTPPSLPSTQILTQYSIWTYRARIYGLAIRLTESWNVAKRDYFMNRANGVFVMQGHRAARYHLFLAEQVAINGR